MSEWNEPSNAGQESQIKGMGASPENSKEWRLIEKMVSTLGAEQRRSRRWGIFFKLLTFSYLLVLLLIASGQWKQGGSASGLGDHTAVVDVHGVIADKEDASASNIISSLQRAFKNENSRAVMLRINSPGGSPVQSGYVYDEIKRLRGIYPQKKVYAVISDIGASGAYYIAAAADEIYADKASLVGSIGVTASGFGFVDTLDKLGVERRVYTSGEHKAFLDPFSPEKPQEVQFWKSVLDSTHQQFIDQVRKGRGDRLKESKETYSGLVWSGEQAVEMGLIDGLGSPESVAREIVGYEDIVDYTAKDDPFEKFAKSMGASMGKSLQSSVLGGSFTIQ